MWCLFGFVFLLALSARTLHCAQASQSPLLRPPLPMNDSVYYLNKATRIANGNLLGDEVFFMAPAYEYFLAMCLPVIGGSVARLLFVQCVLGAFGCGFLFLVGRAIFGDWVGLLAGVAGSLYGVFLYYDCLVMPNSLILVLQLACLACVLASCRRCRAWSWFGTGFLVGVAAIAHGSALALIPAVVASVWVCEGQLRRGRRLAHAAVMLAGCVLTIGTVTLRNYVVGKDFVLLTSNAGMNFCIGNNPEATGSFMMLEFPYKGATLRDHMQGFKRGPSDLPPSEISRRLRAQAMSFIVENPLDAAELWLRNMMLLFNSTEVSVGDQYYFFKRFSSVLRWPLPTFGIVASLGLLGVVFCLPRWRACFPLYAFLVAQIVVFTATFVLGRYRLVLVACLLVFASAMVVYLIERIRQKCIFPIFIAMALFVPLAWLVFHPIDGLSSDNGFGQQYLSLGRKDLASGRLQQAKTAFEHAVSSDFSPYQGRPRFIMIGTAYTAIGDICMKEKQWEDAIVNYEEGLVNFELAKIAKKDKLYRTANDSLRRARRYARRFSRP